MPENLNEQLSKLKTALAGWNEQLIGFKQWALSNDGVLDETEKGLISRLQTEISAVNKRIAQLEKAKANSGNNTAVTNSISESVGKGGTNKAEDVKLVQQLLNSKNNAGLVVDSDCGNKTIAAIEAFQQKTFG